MISLILHENSKLGHLQKCIQDHKNKQQNQNLDSFKNIFEVCAVFLYYKMLLSTIVQKSIMFSYCCDWEGGVSLLPIQSPELLQEKTRLTKEFLKTGFK